MLKTIVQTVDFKANPRTLFALYADRKKHTEATGAEASVSAIVGSRFAAYDGSLTGTVLGVVRDRVFCQTWRSDDWTVDQADSVLTFYFEARGKGGRVTMVHANIPEEHYAGIRSGWTEYYWTPWKKYLAGKKKMSKTKRTSR